MSTQLREGESNEGIENHQSSTARSVPMTEAEAHYRSLADFFKYLVTIVLSGIALLVGVGLYVTNKDMAAMRAEVRQNISDVKSDLKQSLSDVKTDTRTAVDSTKQAAGSAIKGTQDAAETQISQIRGQSASIALGEAQRRVEDAFKNRNIESIVESAAKQQVAPVIERQLRGEVDRALIVLQRDITLFAQIADASDGSREGFGKLLELEKNGPNEVVRLRAKSMREAIADRDEKWAKYVFEGDGVKDKDIAYHVFFDPALDESGFHRYSDMSREEFEKLSEPQKKTHLLSSLVKIIRTSRDMNVVAKSFLGLRELTGYQFRVFDFDAVNGWCAQNSSQCK